jgi:hypothetical protein
VIYGYTVQANRIFGLSILEQKGNKAAGPVSSFLRLSPLFTTSNLPQLFRTRYSGGLLTPGGLRGPDTVLRIGVPSHMDMNNMKKEFRKPKPFRSNVIGETIQPVITVLPRFFRLSCHPTYFLSMCASRVIHSFSMSGLGGTRCDYGKLVL